MAEQTIIPKRAAISKANAQMVAVVAAASFVTIFCLVAANAVFGQIRYQAKVTTAKSQANKQLRENIKAYSQLNSRYQDFDNSPTNIIGGNSKGNGDKDGTNSKIVLDALPYAYDFPGLASSLEKVLSTQNLKVTSIGGSDDQLNQQNNLSSSTPQSIPMPFNFTITNAGYSSVQQLTNSLQQSIRPMQIDTLNISGSASDMSITVNAHTYYQPAKNVSITKKVIK